MGILSSRISTKDMVPLCRHLATSYQAGIPIVRGLELASENSPSKQTRRVMTNMAADIKRGSSLAHAAQAQGKHLTPFFTTLLDAGERGGRLDVMLRDLAQYFEDSLRMRRTFVAMLVYPCFVLTLCWFVGTFAFTLLGQLNFEAMRFDWNALFRAYGMLQLKAFAIVALAAVIALVLHRMGLFRWIVGWVSTHVWPASRVTVRLGLARFFRTLSLLIGSGMNINHCIQASAAVMANPYLQRDVLQAAPHVANGATLVQAFSGVKCLTPTAREMIMVGEEAGELEQSLMKVSEYHLAEARQAISVAMKILVPSLLLFAACTVGYIYIRFFMEYYGKILSI